MLPWVKNYHTKLQCTSYGRYRWKCLLFGISSGPEELQSHLLQVLEGLEGVIIADDILLFKGETHEEVLHNHDERIVALMDRAQQQTLKFNPDKLQFRLKELTFIGHIISDKGIKADPSKAPTIINMPTPVDIQSLLQFIGTINCLSAK